MGLQLAYIGLTLLTNLFLAKVGYTAISATSSQPKKDKILLMLALFVWQLYILILSSSDLLKSYDLPPRFAIAFILPSFIFTAVFLYRNSHKKWIHSIPEQWIIYFQSFRVFVELLFVFSVAPGIFNKEVTIEGYNFDMLFAFTAPIIAFLVYYKNVLPRKMIIYWNYLGLTVLASVIFIFLCSVYKPEIFDSNSPILPLESMTYPYVLLPGFLMPTAVFLHFLSILQVKK